MSEWPSSLAFHERQWPFCQGRDGLDRVTLFRDWKRLTTDATGQMQRGPHEGYFEGDTLYLNHYAIELNGLPPRLSFAAQISATDWSGMFYQYGSSEEGNLAPGTLPKGSIELQIRRCFHEEWSERIRVQTGREEAVRARVSVSLACPIDDIQFEEEMKLLARAKESGLAPQVKLEGARAILLYRKEFGKRRKAPTEELQGLFGERSPRDGEAVSRFLEVTVKIVGVEKSLAVHGGEISVIRAEGMIRKGENLDVILTFRSGEFLGFDSRLRPKIRILRNSAKSKDLNETRILTGNSSLNLMLEQAVTDLHSLQLSLPTRGEGRVSDKPLLIAGVPRYVGIFSRDVLTATWQSAILSHDFVRHALRGIALFAGVRNGAWRDEEPDQLPHEIRLNPRSALGELNREIYYGDVVSTAFWVVSLATAFHWTGNRRLLAEHSERLDRCVNWIRRRIEAGGGFLYYRARTPDGNRHHAWKDSGDAIVDSRGLVHDAPLATSEVQGFCFVALLSAAELYLAQLRPRRSKESFQLAMKLKRRFNEAFWLKDRSYFAVALDDSSKPIDSLTSNPGHCLACGIIDREKVPATVARLMSPELFSGWGVRTLSSDNPAYDPYSYHRGSVWPVENSTIAAGMRLWGFDDEALRIIEGQLAAASFFPGMRLPELLSGHSRSEETPVPGLYPNGNLLQAWSVSALLFHVQILLGLRPYGHLGVLLIKPKLPSWVPWIELDDLRVGDARVRLRAWRDERGETRWESSSKEGNLRIIEQPLELDLQAGIRQRLRDLGKSA